MARRTDQNALRKQNGHRKSLSDREDRQKNTREESKIEKKSYRNVVIMLYIC